MSNDTHSFYVFIFIWLILVLKKCIWYENPPIDKIQNGFIKLNFVVSNL